MNIETSIQPSNANIKDFKNILIESFEKTKTSETQYIENRFEFGYRAIQAKSLLPHGKFVDWLKNTLPNEASVRTAQRYKKSAEIFLSFIININSNNIISQRAREFCTIANVDIASELQVKLNDLECLKSLVGYVASDLTQAQFNEILKLSNILAVKDEKQKDLTETSDTSNTSLSTNPPTQIAFFKELEKDLKAIDAKLNLSSFATLSNANKQNYAEALIERGNAILRAIN